jgi:hypothetical protein
MTLDPSLLPVHAQGRPHHFFPSKTEEIFAGGPDKTRLWSDLGDMVLSEQLMVRRIETLTS